MTWAFGLAGLALFLFLIEIFVPSHGALSVIAFAALAGGVYEAYQVSVGFGSAFLLGVSLAMPPLVMVGFRVFPRTWAGRLLINRGLSFESRPATDERDLGLVGTTGSVLTPLRPAGHALLDGRRVDVLTRGESIEVGAPVRVIEVLGNRVVVARADAPAPSAPPEAPRAP
jgi:membrane-bound serine protease (ClpP class)